MSIFVANTSFEFELEKPQAFNDVSKVFSWQRPCLQLQFLGSLMGKEKVLCYGTPLNWTSSSKLVKVEDLQATESLQSWGYSNCLARFAREKSLQYSMPEWELVRQVNGKIFLQHTE